MKKSLLIVLALMLVLAFATSAMAAQVLQDGSYQSTTATGVYKVPAPMPAGSTFSRTYTPNKFTADGISNYPYEIYLPNEEHPESYRIHSSYTKNTDACASCHSTHTAVGASLLQWYSAYETCMACHDGTISTTYDVASGHIGAQTGPAAFGGAFNTTGGSASNHNVTGALEIASAPGGSTVATTFDSKGAATNWQVEFGCESCHTPHGLGGNARILNPDPNMAASTRAIAKGYNDADAYATTTAKGLAATQEGSAYVVRPAVTVDSASDAAYNGYYFLSSYPYSIRLNVGGVVYAATDAVDHQKNFTVDNSLGYTRVTLVSGRVTNATASNVKIVGVPSMKVTMNISNYLQSDEDVEHVSGMNPYCGACHTDYNTAIASTYLASGYNAGGFTGSGKKETGVYTQAHRHQVGFQWHGDVPGLKFEKGQKGGVASASQYGMECLTCHVAHGVNEDYWAATLTATNKPWNGLNQSITELSGSSALKRMPNMGTCEACHDKGTGNQGYAANTGQNPNPLSATPGLNQTDPVLGNSQFFIGATMTTPDTYVGSAVCSECHAGEYEKWKETYVYTAETAAAALAAGLPANEAIAGLSVDHGHASTNTFKPNKGKPGVNGPSCDHANTLTGNWGVTEYSCHGIGNNLAYGNLSASSAAYAAVPESFKYTPKNTAENAITYGVIGTDAGITCEVCHGSGARHAQAPSSKNIFNPGTKAVGNLDLFQSQTLACLKCHGVINGTEGSATATTVLNINTVNAAQVASLGRVPLGVHASSAQNYTDSKHYTLGIATCITCHDPHESKAEPETKLPYEQLCVSCHDSAGTIMNTMGTNGATHSFKFGMAGQTGPAASAQFVKQRPKASKSFGLNTSGLWDTLTGTGTVTTSADVKVTGASVRVKDAAGNYIVTNQNKIAGFVNGALPGTLSNLRLNGTLVTDVASSVYGHVYIEPVKKQQVIFDKTNPASSDEDYIGNYTADWTSTGITPAITITNQYFYQVYDPDTLGAPVMP